MYIKKLIGKKIYLSPMNPDDYEKFTHWINDNEVGIYTAQISKPRSFQSEREALTHLAQNSHVFAIVDMKSDEAIGVISFMDRNLLHRYAELGIFIGDKNYLSQGYGTEAILLLLNYGFNVLNLNNIMLQIREFNKRGIKCYEKCGFKEFGRRSQVAVFGDKKYDSIYMEILAEDFDGVSLVDKILENI